MVFIGWTIYWFGLHRNVDVMIAAFHKTKFGVKVNDVIKGESKMTYSKKMRKKINNT